MHRGGLSGRPRHRRFGLTPQKLAVGALLAAPIATAAWRAHALTHDGALAAFAVGTLTYGAGGRPFGAVLLGFFVPSVALSRVGRARKKQFVDIGKGGARDAWQVFANGGVATAFAVAAGLRGSHAGPLLAGFAGAYAAATADTWGTEIGTLMRGQPRSIITGRRIVAGLSGGVTLMGTVAEAAGALWIAACAAASLQAPASDLGAIMLGGISGALLDSILGATVQELRRCPACNRTCETNPHVCGTPTALVRGLRGFSNDRVNMAATLTGGVAAAFFARAFGRA